MTLVPIAIAVPAVETFPENQIKRADVGGL
jgi:hypothetical protein